MRGSSINIKNMNYQSYEHNHREYTPSYTIDSADKNEYQSFTNSNLFFDKANKYNNEKESYRKIDFARIKTMAENKYTETTGQKAQSKTQYFIEAVVNSDVHVTKDMLAKLANRLNTEFGIKVLDIAHHKDEGHIDKDGNKNYNYHAHLIFLNADVMTGITVKWDKTKLRKLQDVVAEVLEMPRGIDVRQSKTKRMEHKEYKQYITKISELETKINTVETENKHQKNVIGLLKTSRESLQQILDLLGLDTIKIGEVKKVLKDDYTSARQQLKDSGIATQADYKQLKLDYELLTEQLTTGVSNKKLVIQNSKTETELQADKQKLLNYINANIVNETTLKKIKDINFVDIS
jgi:hypothetical protein